MRFLDFIGGVLYPRQQRWEQRRNVKLLGIAALISLIVMAVFVLVLIKKGGFPINLHGPINSLFRSPIHS